MSDLRHRGSGGEKGGGSDSHSDEGVLVQKPDEEGSSGSEKLPRVDSGMVVAKEEEEGSSDKAVKDEDPLGLTGGGLQHAMARAVVNKYPWVEDVFKTLVPVAAKAGEALNFIGPYAVALFELLRKVYVQLPWEVLTALFGLVLCFFGGAFVTVIAAGEAFKLCGGERVFMNMRVVYRDYQRVRLAARRHDRITKGGKLAPTDALVMAMKSVRDPERLSSSVSGIYTALLAVISTLRLQFARTITLGAAIGGMVKKPVQQYIAPSLENLLEADLRKWVPQFVDWGSRIIGLTIAFYTQRVVSAVESALRGGLLFAKHTLAYLRAHGHIQKTDHDATIETVMGYAMAVLGFYSQVYFAFQVPFPLNVVCWPLTLLENLFLFFV
eukprot:TRINITY_DN13394_c0_g1_i2.p1 TRINITY_DN13394_c0_g1~~TRINITY_DN13394_c0_g1_i2.p1  ORF type:complete len:382 (+),score=139.67 TRINITY_DN13394_c0_g1_i2:72-1217(+)